METVCEYTDGTMYVSSDQQKWINRIRRLSEERPDDVSVIRWPDQNDGCIYCTVPAEWLKISPPKQVNMTDEQRQAASERMKAMVAKQKERRV